MTVSNSLGNCILFATIIGAPVILWAQIATVIIEAVPSLDGTMLPWIAAAIGIIVIGIAVIVCAAAVNRIRIREYVRKLDDDIDTIVVLDGVLLIVGAAVAGAITAIAVVSEWSATGLTFQSANEHLSMHITSIWLAIVGFSIMTLAIGHDSWGSP